MNTNDNTGNNASVFDFRNTNDKSNVRYTSGAADVFRTTGVLQDNPPAPPSPSYGEDLPL